MAVTQGSWVGGAVVGVLDARLNSAASFATNSANSLDVRAGVVFSGNTSILHSTATTAPSMTVTVDPLHFVGTKGNTNGPYVGTNPGTATLNIAAAPGSNSRIDVVYIMQRDAAAAISPDGTTVGELGVVTGVANATPVKPAIPAGAVEVGTVTVAAGATKTNDATVTIATTCLWTVARGGAIPVRNAAERDATLTGFNGMRAQRLDMKSAIDVFTGGAWVDGDTGWIDPTMSTGWTSSGLYPLQVRRLGNRTFMRGGAVRGTGATNAICSVPAGLRPAANKLLNASVSSGGAAVVTPNVATSGTVAITYQTTGVPVGDTLPIDADWLTD